VYVFFVHLAIGLGSLAVGATYLVRREALARKAAGQHRATALGPTGWTVVGGILMLTGLAWVAIALL
jgi:hypothetical protein